MSTVKMLVEKFKYFFKKRIGDLEYIKNITEDLYKLPKFYVNNFNLYTAQLIINDSEKSLEITILEIKNNNFTDINFLKKQISNILELRGGKVDEHNYVLIFSSLEKASQRLLIQNNIPYYSERDQSLFLPFMYLELHSKLEIERSFTPSEQLIICYVIANINKKITQKNLETRLNLSKSIIQKTLKKLEHLEILERSGYTRNLEYKSMMNREEIFSKVIDYLSSPIRKKVYIEKNKIVMKMLKQEVISSESALSQLTLYSEDNIEHYALEKNKFRELESELNENDMIIFSRKNEIELLAKSNPIVSIEEWTYDPNIVKDRFNNIDAISLYKILENSLNQEDDDYRLSQELENMIERYLNEDK